MNIDKTSYNTIHQYRLRKYPKQNKCFFCWEEGATHWANVSGEYKRDDVNDWYELCPNCHKDYDHYKRQLAQALSC